MNNCDLPVICLMGPTASGKTQLALSLVEEFPCEIISVDSAMVYRGLNIGTAKPDPTMLFKAPHRLIDICDPAEIYSAGQFYEDATKAIAEIQKKQKIPLLVGGTMLYFRVLQQGIASLPTSDVDLRKQLQQQMASIGCEQLHAELAKIDPEAAMRIAPNDQQRIQRALEVYYISGQPITKLQRETTKREKYNFVNIVYSPERSSLHQNIAHRWQHMLGQGFIEEVKQLYRRGDLHQELPAIRSVGYRQAWSYLNGDITLEEMTVKTVIATRQLAKRQLTWLRQWQDAQWFGVGNSEQVRLKEFIQSTL